MIKIKNELLFHLTIFNCHQALVIDILRHEMQSRGACSGEESAFGNLGWSATKGNH